MGGRIGKGSDPPTDRRSRCKGAYTRGGGSRVGLPLPRDSNGKLQDQSGGVWGGGQKQHKPITSRVHPRTREQGNWKGSKLMSGGFGLLDNPRQLG